MLPVFPIPDTEGATSTFNPPKEEQRHKKKSKEKKHKNKKQHKHKKDKKVPGTAWSNQASGCWSFTAVLLTLFFSQ